MVDMNPDHIFEVPDTPDRIQQSACPVSSSAARRGISMMPGDPSPNRKLKFKIKTSSNQGQSSRGSAASDQPAPSATRDFFKEADLARSLPEAKLSPPKLDRATGKSVLNDYGVHARALDQSSSISNHMRYMGSGVSSNSCQIREGQVAHRDASRRNLDSLSMGSGLPTISLGRPQNRTKTSTSDGLKEVVGADDFSGWGPSEDKREATNIKGTTGLSHRAPGDVPQRHPGRRKLVLNGRISPSNIVQSSVKADEKQEVCSTSGVLHWPLQADVSHEGTIIDLTDNSPTVTRKGSTVTDELLSANNMGTRGSQMGRAAGTLIPRRINQASSSNCSEGFNNKGKDIIHGFMGTERSGETNTTRVCPRAVVDSPSVVNDDISGLSSQQGWRTKHNHTSRLPRSLLGTTATHCGIESGSSGPSNQGHESTAGDNNASFSAATTTRSASLRNRTTRICRGKRKHTLSSYQPGESSSSLNEHSGSCLASSDTTAGRNHTTLCHNSPVIDIDDISSPEARPSLSRHRGGTLITSNISAQLEADEMLARQLQEQLYNETPRVAPREEIDAIVAMSLQHEEDAGRTSRSVRRFHNDTRAARASRLSAATRARHETAISHMRNAAPVTLGLRAIVAGYHSGHIQPNIDLNDYDALLALDENNHQHTGASESQINNLPQSVFQSTSAEEPCAVCLENPSIGETIRTLPCFHKFHKDCIDEWLRRKKLCPVCKCGITRS